MRLPVRFPGARHDRATERRHAVVGRRARRWCDADPETHGPKPAATPVCPLCERPIPPGARQSRHHLTPKLKGGTHVVAPGGTPFANVLLTMMHKLGVNVDKIGDSTGEIAL